ncbi:MAG: hypothetical protein IPH36_10100 [Saprospiraceae bacterium]|nr:hypothetical protein [Saprospiraceae bacterium]
MNRIFLLSYALLVLNLNLKGQASLDSLLEIGAYNDVILLASNNLEKDSTDILSKKYLAKAAFLGNRLTLAKNTPST